LALKVDGGEVVPVEMDAASWRESSDARAVS
jgi:hypothetical protein